MDILITLVVQEIQTTFLRLCTVPPLSFLPKFYSMTILIYSFSIDYPAMQNIPYIANPPPIPNNAVAPSLIPLAPTRRRPARTPGLVGNNAAFLVPENVRKKFADGWSSYVPLTYLTDKGCLFKDKSSSTSSHDLLTVDPTTGAIQTSSTSLSDDGELDLTFDEWHQAWWHLLDLIRTYFPDEFLMWETHYSFILNSENHAELWPLFLFYDAEIRKRTTRFPIDPSVFSIGIWNDLELRYTTKKVLSLVQADLKHHVSQAPPDRHNSRNPGQNSSFQTHSYSDSKTGRCIFCGDRTKSHISRNCTAACYPNGVPCHLHRVEPSGTRQSKSGKRYCFAWNGPSGCKFGTSCLCGEHICTLCGSTSHTTQLCTIVT